jgi:hypothetical protein
MPPLAKASDHKNKRKKDASGNMWQSRPVTQYRWFRVKKTLPKLIHPGKHVDAFTSRDLLAAAKAGTDKHKMPADRLWIEDIHPMDVRMNSFLYHNFYDAHGVYTGIRRAKPSGEKQ